MNLFNKNRLIVFSQWSRKNYAIFASLGKLIKIGRVSADICNLALKKASAISSLFPDIRLYFKDIPKDEERLKRWLEYLQRWGYNLQTLFYLFLIITNTSCKVEYSLIHIYDQSKSMFCYRQGMDFFILTIWKKPFIKN